MVANTGKKKTESGNPSNQSDDSERHQHTVEDLNHLDNFRNFTNAEQGRLPDSFDLEHSDSPKSDNIVQLEQHGPNGSVSQPEPLSDNLSQKEHGTSGEGLHTVSNTESTSIQETHNYFKICQNYCCLKFFTGSDVPEFINYSHIIYDFLNNDCRNKKEGDSIRNLNTVYNLNEFKKKRNDRRAKNTIKFKRFCYKTFVLSDLPFVECQNDKPEDFEKEKIAKSHLNLHELYTLPLTDTLDPNFLRILVFPASGPLAEATQQSSNTNETQPFPRFDPLMAIVNRIADGERVPPQTSMRYEMLRFCTLRSYPRHGKPYITRLAQAGFYYANSGDEVVCYCCARRRSNWRENENPMDVHREMNPNCRFLLNNAEVNVPVSYISDSSSSSESSSRSPIGRHLESSAESSSNNCISSTTSETSLPAQNSGSRTSNEENVNTSVTEEHVPENGHSTVTVVSGVGRSTPTFSARAVDFPVTQVEAQTSSRSAGDSRPVSTPKYPKYSTRTVRLTSFRECGEIVVAPERLADAGFFYAGFGDCVRCFHCGVGLRHWSEEDDPWIEHSRWSKECTHVRQVKGAEFVNLVQMAVLYAQNQNGNEQELTQEDQGAVGQLTSAGTDETDRLMHTDAAQSVLEMGYQPDIIKRAIQAVLASSGRECLTAANLMEKVLEIEDLLDQQSSALNDTNRNTEEAEQQVEHVVECRDATFENENEEIESPREPVNAEGISSETERKTVDELSSTTQDEVTAEQNQTSNDTTEESAHGTSKGDNETNQDTSPQSKEPGACNSLRTGSTTSSSAITGAVGGKPSTVRKQYLSEQKRLQKENSLLKQQSKCTKCKTKDVCIVFLPCGHLVTCEDCAPTVKYCTVNTCGKYIKGTVRTFLS